LSMCMIAWAKQRYNLLKVMGHTHHLLRLEVATRSRRGERHTDGSMEVGNCTKLFSALAAVGKAKEGVVLVGSRTALG